MEQEQAESNLSIIAQLAEKNKPSKVSPTLIRALLLGFSGTGKSISATTAPGKVLFLDFDGRATSIARFPNAEAISIPEHDPLSPSAWDTGKKILSQIKSETAREVFPFDSVVFDGITMMGRVALNWALLLDPKRGLGGGAAMQHYLPQMNELSKFILASLSLPVHVIYTAHLELVEDKAEETFFILPKTTGKLRTELPGWFNETYLTSKRETSKGIEYLWTLTGAGKYQFCKTAIPKAPQTLTIDFTSSEPRGFSRFFSKAEKQKDSLPKLCSKYNQEKKQN